MKRICTFSLSHFEKLAKGSIAIFLLLGLSLSGRAQSVVAGWTFPVNFGDAAITLVSECGATSGTLYADGTNGSTNWINAAERQYFIGNAPSTPLCSVNTATGAYALVSTSRTIGDIVFKLATTGYRDLQLLYDTKGTATGYNTHEWAYSTDGVNFTSVATITGRNDPTFSTQTVDFSAILALNNQSVIYIKLTLSGAAGASESNSLDNIRFLAMPVCTPPIAPTASAASAVDLESFSASWNPVPGATGYYVDVYTAPVAADLFISEYVEGSGNNKYIEIFNGTGASVDLSKYRLRLYSNGVSTTTIDTLLGGTLANNSVVVYKNSSATIYGGGTNNAAVNFNGNDAVALYKISTNSNVDIFGRIGEDPGSAWTAGGNATLDRTLVRNPTISSGVTINPASGFPALASEWTSYPIDNVTHLGSHNFISGFVPGYQNVYTTNNFLQVTNLAAGTNYYYVVRADNGNCSSVNSNQVSVTTNSCISSPHTITSLLPIDGPPNTRVTITGTGFTNVTKIKIGNVAIPSSNFTVVNSSTIVAKIPFDAVTGPISVYNNGCPKASSTFTVFTNSANCGGGSGISADLFISEVFNSSTGSSSYVEIYNGTSAPVDLSAYKLRIFTGTPAYIALSGMIQVGGTAVVKIGSSGTDCTGFPYLDRSGVSGFSGNTELDLYRESALIDAVLTPNEIGFSMIRNTATGAPSATYTIAQWVTNSTESCSNLGTTSFSITSLLTIDSSPSDFTGCPAGSITFSVSATANPTPVSNYTWYYNDAATMSGWQTVSAGLGIAGNTPSITLPTAFANLQNYQFYCRVTKINGDTCAKYSNAAQFSYPTKPFYKANTLIGFAGEWTTPASWLMSDDNITYVAACAYPVASNSSSVLIPSNMGIKHSQNISFEIDQITIDAGAQLEIGTGNSQSRITILNGNVTGADLIVNGTLYDRAKSGYGIKMDINGNDVINPGEGTWQLGSTGALIKTNQSSASEYRNMYYNGIVNIPAGANWIYRHNGDNLLASPLNFASSNVATPMYYPNLTLENTINGNTISSAPNATNINLSDFTLTGANNPVIIKGDFNVGGNGPGYVNFANANTSGLLQVMGNLTVKAGSKLSNDAAPNSINGLGIDLKGNLIVDGILDNNGSGSNGLLKLSGNSSQIISGLPSGIMDLQDVTIANTGGAIATVNKSFGLAGVLTLSNASNLNLNSGYVTLKSTATATAMVAPINTGNITYSGTGRFVVERFFPTRRAWRLMTAPVSTGPALTDNSFFNSYQAGGNNTAANAGNGTYVSGANADPATNGLDVTPLNNYSLKLFDAALGNYVNVTNTKELKISNNTFNAGQPDNFGFFMFVRGDRFNNPNWVTPGVPVNVTTLRDTGKIQTQTYTFNATPTIDKYTLIGNPYASPVDFTKVLTNGSTMGVYNKFWSWDPNLNTVGAYVLFDGGAGYAATKVPLTATGTVGQTKIIQSKQAVFVQTSNASSPKVVFREVDKDAANNQAAFRPAELPTVPMLASNIYYLENTDKKVLLDGNMVQSAKEFSNQVTNWEDAIKFTNINENFGIRNGSQLLILDRREPLTENDTIFYTLTKTSRRKYQLEFIAEKINGDNLVAYLEDSYLKSATPINMTGETWTEFEINGEAASADINRFRVVFKKAAHFTNIDAHMLNEDISVTWSLMNEMDMRHHMVERSTDGVHFETVGTVDSKGNAAKGDYSLLDVHPAIGMYYYRVKSVGKHGSIGYSDVVKVKMVNPQNGIYVFPNPVTDNNINLQMNKAEKGTYQVKLVNGAGKLMLQKQIVHPGGSVTHTIQADQYLADGTYQLEVAMPGKKGIVIGVVIKR